MNTEVTRDRFRFIFVAGSGVTEREIIQRELEILVDEFYHSLRHIHTVLRKRHKRELLQLARHKRNECRTQKAAERREIPMEIFSSNDQLLHVRPN